MKKHIVRRPRVDDSHLPHFLPPVIKQIYASRGVVAEQELELTLKQLLSVDTMRGVSEASDILCHAIKQGEQITVIGDFDADGATSTALMMEALSLFSSQNHTFLVPNRFEYGYGLSPQIAELAVKQGAQLIVTVDNGISCHQGVETAKAMDCKVIVTDHHLPGEKLPPADAIVNPNQVGCEFASKSIAGVGVAFYLMLAVRRQLVGEGFFEVRGIDVPNIAQLLDLVALGTVADVVSLDANNRVMVEQGLKRIRAGYTRPGIQALIEISGRNQQRLVASDFGFALGPRINAAGRLDDMSFGINCLLAKDLMSARAMAVELDALNKARREIEQGMQLEAETIMAQLNFKEDNLPFAISLHHKDWHQGVIGIVAGRLKEKFHRPSIVFAQADENESGESCELKGSARSIPGLHIRDLLEHIDSQNPGLITKFGGHAMAAGLSIPKNQFEQFTKIFNQLAKAWLKPELLEGQLLSDGELDTSLMSLEFAEQLRAAGPWGQNFEEPLFDGEFELVQQRIVGEKHLKLVVQKAGKVFDGIAFNVDVRAWPNHAAKQVHLAYRLDINEFRGNTTVQLMVEHIRPI